MEELFVSPVDACCHSVLLVDQLMGSSPFLIHQLSAVEAGANWQWQCASESSGWEEVPHIRDVSGWVDMKCVRRMSTF